MYVYKPQGKIKTYLQIAWSLKTPVVLLQDKVYFPCLVESLYEFAGKMPYMPYKKDISDCDNFSFVYKGIADRENNSVGIILGKHDGELHEWNMAITNEGIRQIEPQHGHIFIWDAKYRPMIVLL